MQICHPHLMGVIGVSLEENYEVTLHYEVVNYEGNISVMESTGILITDLNYTLLRPQDHFMDLQRLENP